MSRLKEMYKNEIMDAMTKKFGYKNVMEVPKLDKIVINMGVGEAKENAKLLDAAIADMELITGQKAIATKAKKSVANFKIREGMPIGCKVTLRGEKMYEFADRLINLALPRVRDFRGVNPNAFDGRGNYALGIKEQLIFPEVEYDKVDKVRGMDIIFVTTAKTDEEARELLTWHRCFPAHCGMSDYTQETAPWRLPAGSGYPVPRSGALGCFPLCCVFGARCFPSTAGSCKCPAQGSAP